MGLGKTIQAVSLIMSDFPAKKPSLVLVPPVALMQWTSEIASYTDGTLKTFIFHGTNIKSKGITAKELKTYDVVIMSYNSLESIYRKQEKGFARKNGIHMEPSVIHKIKFHRVILDEAHCIKVCLLVILLISLDPVWLFPPHDSVLTIVKDQNNYDRESLLRPPSHLPLVPHRDATSKQDWRVLLARQVPQCQTLLLLSL